MLPSSLGAPPSCLREWRRGMGDASLMPRATSLMPPGGPERHEGIPTSLGALPKCIWGSSYLMCGSPHPSGGMREARRGMREVPRTRTPYAYAVRVRRTRTPYAYPVRVLPHPPSQTQVSDRAHGRLAEGGRGQGGWAWSAGELWRWVVPPVVHPGGRGERGWSRCQSSWEVRGQGFHWLWGRGSAPPCPVSVPR